MADRQGINYGRFMERAMRGVMAEVLGHVAKRGLPGDHHFYISFDTTHPGVDIPAYLRERYPREMMIVLQEWFEDLAVTGHRFGGTLDDDEPGDGPDGGPDGGNDGPGRRPSADVVSLDRFRKQ